MMTWLVVSSTSIFNFLLTMFQHVQQVYQSLLSKYRVTDISIGWKHHYHDNDSVSNRTKDEVDGASRRNSVCQPTFYATYIDMRPITWYWDPATWHRKASWVPGMGEFHTIHVQCVYSDYNHAHNHQYPFNCYRYIRGITYLGQLQ